jgi:hypothetical protein
MDYTVLIAQECHPDMKMDRWVGDIDLHRLQTHITVYPEICPAHDGPGSLYPAYLPRIFVIRIMERSSCCLHPEN